MPTSITTDNCSMDRSSLYTSSEQLDTTCSTSRTILSQLSCSSLFMIAACCTQYDAIPTTKTWRDCYRNEENSRMNAPFVRPRIERNNRSCRLESNCFWNKDSAIGYALFSGHVLICSTTWSIWIKERIISGLERIFKRDGFSTMGARPGLNFSISL